MKKEEVNELWKHTVSSLDEVQRRRVAGMKAIEIGRGGIKEVCRVTGLNYRTVKKGITEVKAKKGKPMRLRRKGGGRKKLVDKNPKIKEKIEAILEESTAGDPMKSLKWTHKSTYKIAEEISSSEQKVSKNTIRRTLKTMGYTLQANKKSKEQGTSEERDSQFNYINKQVKEFSKQNLPVISVDTKKKELIGEFKNQGNRWLKKGKAEIVNVYDFPSLAKGKAIPYGSYDIMRNEGFVNVGISADTAEFAVESISQWWNNIGKKNYPQARGLLICADSGGSNGNRSKLWKYSLSQFAKKNKIKVTVLHYPPGTSKWNKIEHRMFSFISMNWKGKPLISYEIIINLIKATTTKTGLKIDATLDKKVYEVGKRISDEEMKKINITNHEINQQWNYTIH